MDAEITKEIKVLAENLTKESVESIFTILEIYAKNSENKIDDMIIPFLPSAKAFVLKYAEKIDGE